MSDKSTFGEEFQIILSMIVFVLRSTLNFVILIFIVVKHFQGFLFLKKSVTGSDSYTLREYILGVQKRFYEQYCFVNA